jgi:hypothetical protein
LAKARAEIQALKQQHSKNYSPRSDAGMLVTPSPRRSLENTQEPAPKSTRSEGGTPTPNGAPPSTPATTPSPASSAAAKVEGD